MACFGGVGQVDYPVVRQGDVLPSGVVEVGGGGSFVLSYGFGEVGEVLGAVGEVFFHACGVAEVESPVVVDESRVSLSL